MQSRVTVVKGSNNKHLWTIHHSFYCIENIVSGGHNQLLDLLMWYLISTKPVIIKNKPNTDWNLNWRKSFITLLLGCVKGYGFRDLKIWDLNRIKFFVETILVFFHDINIPAVVSLSKYLTFFILLTFGIMCWPDSNIFILCQLSKKL